ncbi:MAG TPA: hypothetical protein VF702_08910 [Allosphingosinicella sp.]|jgi:hypothetical protein
MNRLFALLLALSSAATAHIPRPPPTEAEMANARALVAALPISPHFSTPACGVTAALADRVQAQWRLARPGPAATGDTEMHVDQVLSGRIREEVERLLPEAAAAVAEPLAQYFAMSLPPGEVEALRIFFQSPQGRPASFLHVADSRRIDDLLMQELFRRIWPRLPAFEAESRAHVGRLQRANRLARNEPLIGQICPPGF